RYLVESGKATDAINSAWEALRAFDEHSPWTQRCLLTMSYAYVDLGFPTEATSLARQALDLSCECKFDEGRATSNIALAWTDLRRGEVKDGLSRIVHSVQVFKQSSDSFQLVRAWNDAAIFLQSMGQHRRALDVWETAFNLLDPADEHFCTLVIGGMAASQAELGSRTGAMRTLMNCISYAERNTRPKALVTHYYDFANTLRRGGEPQKALVAAAKGQKVAADADLFYSSENFFDLMTEEYQKMGN
ncbi:MAG: hypothetical protein K8R88_14060, partial [Armatimonadetes bacterium]|nr:hypothetical protein [Armatimonadota bacterium]